jgi:phosphonoacetaldehyde hydrolase
MPSAIQPDRRGFDLKAVVLDWAGTTVDYGCLGPAAVFVEAFARFDIAVSVAQARRFMGMAKKEHIRALCRLDSVRDQWERCHGRAPVDADVDAVYALTEPLMVAAAARHADPIPGALETVDAFRQRGLAIGSCTGYTAPMMAALMPAAQRCGYRPDAMVCASDVPAGRPCPWMCYLNAMRLNVYPMAAMVKIGDTVSDIEEGRNAGMWTVGLTRSGNELGLSLEQTLVLDPADLNARLDAIRRRFMEAGADYTAEGIWEIVPIVDEIAARLKKGERPAAGHVFGC